MWFKNLCIYSLDTAFAMSAQQLADFLAKHQFVPSGSQEPLSLGWVAPREGGELVHEVNRQYLICMRAEKKLLPSAVVNQATREKTREIDGLQRQITNAQILSTRMWNWMNNPENMTSLTTELTTEQSH